MIIKITFYLYRTVWFTEHSFQGIPETAVWHVLYYPLVADVKTCDNRRNASLTKLAYGWAGPAYEVYIIKCYVGLDIIGGHILAVLNDWTFQSTTQLALSSNHSFMGEQGIPER